MLIVAQAVVVVRASPHWLVLAGRLVPWVRRTERVSNL
uniref:Uncharacterized protein n=1 Tax=Anguilla anguilla TaxID=7936 RepID=A0A0E9PRH3_ANGAN